ncbi:MAG: winged helix-turn-helix domain-containing protein [Candidatus Bathycorpusculaceae bacterium]
MLVQSKKRISNSHRCQLDVIADILEASQERTRKTYLMYRCNMSFKQLKQYLEILLSTGLLCIVAEKIGSNPGFFKITEKGKAFLKAYKDLKALLK